MRTNLGFDLRNLIDVLEGDFSGNFLARLVSSLLDAGGLFKKVRAWRRLNHHVVGLIGFDLDRGGDRHALLVDLCLAVEVVAHLLDIELTLSALRGWFYHTMPYNTISNHTIPIVCGLRLRTEDPEQLKSLFTQLTSHENAKNTTS